MYRATWPTTDAEDLGGKDNVWKVSEDEMTKIPKSNQFQNTTRDCTSDK
jgi:hypothetical protein